MSNSKTVSISLPADMVARIDAIAASRYKSHDGKPNRSQLILDAIAMYFNHKAAAELLNIPSPIDKLRDLEIKKRLDSLEDRYQQLANRQPFAGSGTSSVEAKTTLAEADRLLAGSGHSILQETDPKLISKRLEIAGQNPHLDAIGLHDLNATQNPHLGNLFPGKSVDSILYRVEGIPIAQAKTDPVIIAWMKLFPGLEAAIDNGQVVSITGTDSGYRLTVTPDLDPTIEKGLRWLGITLDTHGH